MFGGFDTPPQLLISTLQSWTLEWYLVCCFYPIIWSKNILFRML